MSSVSFFSKFEGAERILLNKSEAVAETRQKLASGDRIQQPSDDPAAIVDINRFSDQLDNIQQIQDNIDNGQTTLENSEGVMQRLSDLLQRSRQLSVKAANDTLEEDARKSIATEINQRLEEAVNVANTRIGGKYIFSGTETVSDQQPFEISRNGEGEIIEVSYHGDANFRENKISEGQTIATNITGNRLFQATNQGIVGDYEFEYGGELQKALSESVGYQQLDDPPPAKTIATAPDDTGAGSKTALQVSDASEFKVGETVTVTQENGSNPPAADGDQDTEETVITRIDPGTNTIELDLKNNYDVSGSNTVQVKSQSDGGTATVSGGVSSGGAGFPPAGPFVNTFGNDASTTFEVNNVNGLSAGDRVRIEDPTTGAIEERVIQQVSTGPPEITVDLSETTADDKFTTNATVTKVADRTNPVGEGTFEIDGEKFFYNTRRDSIVDIARRINERGIQVQAKFIEDKQPQPEASQTLSANAGPGSNVAISVSDSSNFKEGQKVFLEDDNNREKSLITDVDDSTNTITVDSLNNGYTTADDAEIRTVEVEEPEEFTVDEVVSASEERSYRFMLKSRVPHKIALKDYDRRPDATPDQVEGLMNDLQLLGNGSGGPPEPSPDEDFPNSYHKDAKIHGKSIFDAMIDLRESLQQADDPDGDTDDVTQEFNLPKGNAQRNAYFDPERIETIEESIEDFGTAIDNVSINRSIGGARLNRLETADQRSKDFEVNTKDLLSKIRDADLAQVITDLRRQEAVRQAALQMTAQVNRQTLANFI